MVSSGIYMLTLSSDPSNIRALEKYVHSLANHYNITEDKFPNILISLTEAVNNAIHHGNNCDCTKQVRIRLKETTKGLRFRISDEGKGFDPQDLPDPTCEENIEKSGGRGVFLINALTDRVCFKNKGRTIEMDFHL